MDKESETLSILKAESLVSIESKICKLFSGNEYKLRFPTKLNTRGALGIEVALVQLIGTWLHKSDKRIFHSYQNNNPDEFIDLCKSIYGLAMLTMANEIWDDKKNLLSRKTVLSNAKETIESIRKKDFSSSFTSRYFGIPCIKKPSYDKEFFMPIYNGNKVIQAGAFLSIIKKILEDTICGESRFEIIQQSIGVEDLSELLWELFNNTHDHGRIDAVGNELPYNFRSIIIQQQDITQKYFKSWLGDKPSLAQQNFYENLNNKTNNQPLLDISVVDFGKGFVSLAKQKVGSDDDLEVLLKCLESGWSRLRKKNRGVGLTKVLEKVNKHKGWLRVRTGNLLIEKAYTTDDKTEITKDDITIMDNHVVGTSFHISIPLNKIISSKGK